MTGTPTGRINRDSDFYTEMFKSLQMESPPRYLREAMAVLGESAEKAYVAVDFSRLEDRTVALLCSMGPDGMMIHEEVKLYERIQGRKATMCIIDDLDEMCSLFKRHDGEWHKLDSLGMLEDSNIPEMPDFGPTKTMKQNGRSASYLDLDPTKKNINKRRKK